MVALHVRCTHAHSMACLPCVYVRGPQATVETV